MEIKIVKQILEWNEDVSAEIKRDLAEKKVCLVNVMGSPGAGKTSLLKQIIGSELGREFRIGVIEGDIAGQIDADAIAALGVPVVQLQTDGACHIEAKSIQNILPMFEPDMPNLIFVENIGNLVCPAEFNIGEDFRVSILSIPEGDDKVEKYPLMFQTTDALVLNKYDMLPYFDFDEARVERNEYDINPGARIFKISSKTGEGLDELVPWLRERAAQKTGSAQEAV